MPFQSIAIAEEERMTRAAKAKLALTPQRRKREQKKFRFFMAGMLQQTSDELQELKIVMSDE
jgi:hypothetical protein